MMSRKLPTHPARLNGHLRLFERTLLDSEIDDCALGDGARGGFDGDLRRSSWREWHEDIAVTGTARDEAGEKKNT